MYKFSLAMAACLMLAGCSSDSDLDVWMAQQKEDQKSQPPFFLRKYNVAKPAPFNPYIFQADNLKSPFDSSRVLQEMRKNNPEVAQVDQQLLAEWKAEQDRVKQHLESYPLESMVMVGFIKRKDEEFALIKLNEGDNGVYYVKVGEYLGLDNGKIQQITDTSIDLRELVQTGQGNVVERFKTLQLQEGETS